MTTNIQQITPMLHVPDIGAARHFFEKVLGFVVSFSMDGYFYCERDGAGVRVLEEEAHKPVSQAKTRMTVYIDVRDVDTLFGELQSALETLLVGAVVPPKNYPWNQREFHVRMPDGNVMAFGQPVQETV